MTDEHKKSGARPLCRSPEARIAEFDEPGVLEHGRFHDRAVRVGLFHALALRERIDRSVSVVAQRFVEHRHQEGGTANHHGGWFAFDEVVEHPGNLVCPVDDFVAVRHVVEGEQFLKLVAQFFRKIDDAGVFLVLGGSVLCDIDDHCYLLRAVVDGRYFATIFFVCQ